MPSVGTLHPPEVLGGGEAGAQAPPQGKWLEQGFLAIVFVFSLRFEAFNLVH